MTAELSALTDSEASESLAVLYVDGDEARRSAVLRDLGARRHRVVVAGTGREALDQVARESFDGVLLAHTLPDLPVLEVLADILAKRPRTPVILIVPPGFEDLEIQALRGGAAETLVLTPRFPGSLAGVLEREVRHARTLERLARAGAAGVATARRRDTTVEQLAESERRFSLALAQAPVIVWTTDPDLRFTWGTGAILDSLGPDPSAFRGRGVGDVFPGEGESSPVGMHRRALSGRSARFELAWKGRWFEARLEPMRGEDGSIRGVIGIALDLTDRRRAEEALRLSEERFVLLGRATSDMAWDWDLETDSIWRNENLETLFGYTADDMEPVGAWWELHIHPDDRGRVIQGLHEAIARGDRSWSAEYRWQRKDGRYVMILDRGYVVHNEDGKPVRMIGSTMDVTERRHEERLREALYRISEAAVTSRDLPALYAEVHRIIGGLMPAGNFYIALHEPETDMLSFPYFVDEEEAPPAPYKAGHGLTEYVLRSGQPFYASAEGYERLVSEGHVVRVGPKSIDWVGVPLIAHGRTIGVLVIQTYTEGLRYGERERDILSYVSEQVAMAIERKRAQEALEAAEAKFRRLVEQSLMGIYIIQAGHFKYVNPKFAEVFGYTPEEIVSSKRVSDLVSPEDRGLVEENIRRRLVGELASLHYSFTGLRQDGLPVSLEVHGSQMDFDGRPAIIGSLLDVSERRRAEEELHRSELRFRALFEAAADAILLVNAKGVILDANPATEALVQMGRKELVGAVLEHFLASEDLERARSYLRGIFRAQYTEGPFEVTIRLPNGLRRSLAVHSRLVSEPGSERYAEMMIRDVTEQQDMQRRLLASERLASVGQMAAYIAHEINTPLANISLLAAASKRRTKDAEIRERLDKIDVQRRQAAAIIADLLSFTKHRDIHPMEVDLRAVLMSAVDQMEPYRTPDVELVLELGEAAAMSRVDPLQMQEVFVNLLRNALEATDHGAVTVHLESRPGYRLLTVADTGPGIPPDVQGRLFQPFVSTKRQKGGTGLGLALCRNIVTAHGGEIHFTSTPGQGTTFTVTIPQEDVA